jgi:hypothetical protein
MYRNHKFVTPFKKKRSVGIQFFFFCSPLNTSEIKERLLIVTGFLIGHDPYFQSTVPLVTLFNSFIAFFHRVEGLSKKSSTVSYA